jgi:tetratricopeptide (TPR) repeat protein
MQSVERELATILTAPPMTSSEPVNQPNPSPAPIRVEPPSTRVPGQSEPLRGAWQRSTTQSASADELRRQGFRRGLGAAAVVAGIAAIAFVFFALPRFFQAEQPAQYKQAASSVPAKPAAPEEPKKEVDFAALARAKQDADDRRGPLEERLKKLAARAAEQWAARSSSARTTSSPPATKITKRASTSLHSSTSTRSIRCSRNWRSALASVLAAQLKAGATALQEGRSADAKTAFNLATKIEPGNKVAEHGLKRANTLDEVLNLVAGAERMEKESNPVGAVEQFRKALALDAEAPRAADGIARIEAKFASDAFASTMARGYAALAKADYTGARSAFEAARRVRPNAPEIPTALKQIEQEQRTGTISETLGVHARPKVRSVGPTRSRNIAPWQSSTRPWPPRRKALREPRRAPRSTSSSSCT